MGLRGIKIAVASLFLSGCASVNYIKDNYDGVPITSVQTKHDTFRVHDKPAENRMMITSSIGAALAGGMLSGLTLGSATGTPPTPVFEEAANKYLAETGRAHCSVKSVALLLDPQFEAKYECKTPPQANAKDKGAK